MFQKFKIFLKYFACLLDILVGLKIRNNAESFTERKTIQILIKRIRNDNFTGYCIFREDSLSFSVSV
ncbi:hypothetical protein CTV95_17325 [Pectobacterium brasiliense]|nr:hypothetical protein CTV95_17325 [Pectobacterium brasiliense]